VHMRLSGRFFRTRIAEKEAESQPTHD